MYHVGHGRGIGHTRTVTSLSAQDGPSLGTRDGGGGAGASADVDGEGGRGGESKVESD